jgi:hypothetical protein
MPANQSVLYTKNAGVPSVRIPEVRRQAMVTQALLAIPISRVHAERT